QNRGLEVYGKVFVPQSHIQFPDTIILKERCIVDQKPNRPELAGRIFHKLADIRFRGEVSTHDTGFSASFVYGRCEGCTFVNRVVAVYRDRKAMGGKVFDD